MYVSGTFLPAALLVIIPPSATLAVFGFCQEARLRPRPTTQHINLTDRLVYLQGYG